MSEIKTWKEEELKAKRDEIRNNLNSLNLRLKNCEDDQKELLEEKFVLQERLLEIKDILQRDYDIFD